MILFGDTHFPYVNPLALSWALNIVKKRQPKYIVQIGDLYDFYWASRYTKRWFEFSPDEEVTIGRKQALQFWEKVKKAAPRAKCYQLLGNHDVRPMLRALDRAPELLPFMNLEALFNFPGVTTIHDPRQELKLTTGGWDVTLQHGHYSKLGDHMKYNDENTAVGHSHAGGSFFQRRKQGTLWELNVGFLADTNAGPMKYRKQNKCKKTLGLGEIDLYGPRFMPYPK